MAPHPGSRSAGWLACCWRAMASACG